MGDEKEYEDDQRGGRGSYRVGNERGEVFDDDEERTEDKTQKVNHERILVRNFGNIDITKPRDMEPPIEEGSEAKRGDGDGPDFEFSKKRFALT